MRGTAFFLLCITFLPCTSARGQPRGVSACLDTARNIRLSCRAEAQSEYWLARAKCAMIGDGEERGECDQEAFESLLEGWSECQDRTDVRVDFCTESGEDLYDPEIGPDNFVELIDNPYFPLLPGTSFVYEGETEDGLEVIVVVVTHQKREILGVECTVVRDTVKVDGEIVEDTLDYYAQDVDGNVWYFGELSFELEGGQIDSLSGSWEAGVDGARPGIIMKAVPVPGEVYRQELLLREAEDMARVVSVSESVEIGLGAFTGVLKTDEFLPTDPEADENKYYAPGLGHILEVNNATGEEVELVAFFVPGEVEQADFSIDYNPLAGTAQMELALEGGGEVFRFQIYGPGGELQFEAESFSPGEAGPEGLNLDSFDAPLEDLLEEWPEGEYLVVAWGIDGQLFSGEGEVSHDLLDPATVTSPPDGATGVSAEGFSVHWELVDGAELYRVEVAEADGDTSVFSTVPGDTTSIAIDPEFFQPGAEYEIDLEVVGENGNVTSSISFFTIAE